MNGLVGAKLKELLDSSVRDELLDDPRRLAELVRERLGPDHKREASFLNTVMQEGVPKRLLAMSSSSLTSAMIANYAKRVSDDTGLREEVARSAIEAWSVGLGLTQNIGRQTQSDPHSVVQEDIAPVVEGQFVSSSTGGSAGPWDISLIGIFMMMAAIPVMIFSYHYKWVIAEQALPMFAIAAFNIYAGLSLVLICYPLPGILGVKRAASDSAVTAQRVRGTVVNAGIINFFTLGIASFFFSWRSFEGLLFLATVVLPSIAAFRLYRGSAVFSASAKLALFDPVAILLFSRGLFGLWMFGLYTSDIATADNTYKWTWEDAGWLLLLPLSFAAVLVSLVIFSGAQRIARRPEMAAACIAGAFLFCLPALVLTGGWELPWDYKLLDTIGVLVDLAVVALVAFDYLRPRSKTEREDRIQFQ